MSSGTVYAHIRSDPGVCSGLPRIDGTRIRVIDIVVLARRGRTPEEILDSYEHLTLGQVHAALAYYYDHKAEVDEQLEATRLRGEEFRRANPDLCR